MTTEKTTDQELKTAAEASFSGEQDGENQPAAPETDSATSTSPGVTAEFLQHQLSKKDETISALRDQAAQSALQAQIDALESENRNADIADSREVDSGEMSAEEAIQRSHQRQDAAKEKAQSLQQQSLAQEANETDYVNSALLARFSYAQEFAQEFGVDADVLMGDKAITSPDEMRLKARELSLDNREAEATGTERFDSGQRGAISSDLENMSALEKVRAGLATRRR